MDKAPYLAREGAEETMRSCSCENVERMMREMAARRDDMPEPVKLCHDQIVGEAGKGDCACCMNVLWLYYAFFCENTHSVSEEARHILLPLLEGRMVEDEEEREWVESGRRGK